MFSSKKLNEEINHIIDELDSQVYADRKTIESELLYFSNLLKNKSLKDKAEEEIITELFNEVIEEISIFFTRYSFVPGMNITSKINDVVINYSTGYTDYTKNKKLDINTMFDIASISKTPTAILMYKAIEEKLFNINDKVKSILYEFNNLPDDLSIKNILNYQGKYMTDGRIDDKKNKIEALKCIKSVLLEDKNPYNYNDIVPIMCGLILERINDVSLMELLKKEIIIPFNIKNIEFSNHVTSKDNITGTPNISKGLCNDPKANILGGYPGSAGIFCTTTDSITIFENLLKGNIFQNNLKDFYTPHPLKLSRGIAGQSIVPTKIEKKGYFSNLSPIMSLGEDGSTRTIAMSGKYVLNKTNYYVSTAIFTNPCSSNPDIIKYYEKKNNKNNGDYYKFYSNIDAFRVDVREILPSFSLDDILFALQKFNLRVSLLYAYIKSHQRDYTLNLNINIKGVKQ